jgi:phosphoenolpyruvate carboxylase
MRNIPSTMVSQHPDHGAKPYWLNREYISTDLEWHECFLSFSDLGAGEYKWDWEGKFVDEAVIERLFGQHYSYFKKNNLGKDKFLTFRLPNPKVQTEFRLGRAFMGILGASILAKQVGLHTPPLFEVILPMTESAQEMIDIQEAFAEIANLKHPIHKMTNGSLKHIELIPLFEQVDTIIRSDAIIDEYLIMHKQKFGFKPDYLRPYVARSDPALNSGLVPAVLAIKIALSKFADFENQKNIKLFPIIGSASLPFRGGLTPNTVKQFCRQYAGIRTALIQSAFRYDFPKKLVIKAIKELEKTLPNTKPEHIYPSEIMKLKQIINTFELFYRGTVEGIAKPINTLANYLPKRRERFQHIGLFGYSRGVGKVRLPRAIGFTAALYNLGAPPEFIATGRALAHISKNGNAEILEKYYQGLKDDLVRAGRFVNKKNLANLAKSSTSWSEVLEDILKAEKYFDIEFAPETDNEKEHQKQTTKIYKLFKSGKKLSEALLTKTAVLRQSMG